MLTSFLYWFVLPILGVIIEGGLLVFFLLKKRPPSLNFLSRLYKFYFFFLIIYAFFLTGLHYYFWSQGEITQYLLPPITPFNYFIHYSFYYFFLEIIIRLIFSLLIFLLILFFNQKFEKTFFFEEEKYLAAIGILTVGWPYCLLYLIVILVLSLITQLINLIIKKYQRISFLYLWVPAALLILFMSGIINQSAFYNYWRIIQFFNCCRISLATVKRV